MSLSPSERLSSCVAPSAASRADFAIAASATRISSRSASRTFALSGRAAGFLPMSARDLLRDAVERAAALEDGARARADDASTGKQWRDRRDRRVVERGAVRGHDHGAIADVEVDVA